MKLQTSPAIRAGVADLIDLPEVGRAEVQRSRGVAVIGHGLGRSGAGGDGGLSVPKNTLCEVASRPGRQVRSVSTRDARGGVGRLRLAGLHRDVEEPHLAQAGLRQHAAPVAVDRQLDELGHDAAEIDDRVGRVGRRAGRLGELRHAVQRRPGLRRRRSTRS